MQYLNKVELTIRIKKGGSGEIKKEIEIESTGSDFSIINQAKLKWLNDYISRDYPKPVYCPTLSDANIFVKNAFTITGKITSKNY